MAYLATPPQPALAALNQATVQLWLPRVSLSRCIRAALVRSTVGVGRHWPAAWHHNHFPASPYCTIGWFFQGDTDHLFDDRRPSACRGCTSPGPSTTPPDPATRRRATA